MAHRTAVQRFNEAADFAAEQHEVGRLVRSLQHASMRLRTSPQSNNTSPRSYSHKYSGFNEAADFAAEQRVAS